MMGDWINMAGYGLGHWIAFTVIAVAILYPIGRILGRIGLSPFWSILAFVPFVNVVALWLVAFMEWPSKETSRAG